LAAAAFHWATPPQGASKRGRDMGEWLKFDKMIAPVVIQIIFWIASVIIVIVGIIGLFSGGFFGFVQGVLTIVLGPILVRIYCEIIIVFFRILENLQEINANTRKG
jgi:Domain of unknown function (DUF4282)